MKPLRLTFHALRTRLINRQDRNRAWKVGKVHYDLGNEFYAAMLDERMTYTREAAARYSFLLAMPAVLAAGLYQLRRSWEMGSPIAPGPTALATLIAFFVGYGVIVWFLKVVSTRSYIPFVVYRVALGLVVFSLLATGTLQAQ